MHFPQHRLRKLALYLYPQRTETKPAIRFSIRGENLKAVAQPLFVFVGKEPLQFVRIAPDERRVEGILLNEPEPGEYVEVHLGDQDAVRHPRSIDLAEMKRLKP